MKSVARNYRNAVKRYMRKIGGMCKNGEDKLYSQHGKAVTRSQTRQVLIRCTWQSHGT